MIVSIFKISGFYLLITLVLISCNDNNNFQETDLIGDCERGCRFFEYAETSDLLNFNETAFHLLCMSSKFSFLAYCILVFTTFTIPFLDCDEAYTVEKKRGVCGSGCSYAKQEVDKILEVNYFVF